MMKAWGGVAGAFLQESPVVVENFLVNPSVSLLWLEILFLLSRPVFFCVHSLSGNLRLSSAVHDLSPSFGLLFRCVFLVCFFFFFWTSALWFLSRISLWLSESLGVSFLDSLLAPCWASCINLVSVQQALSSSSGFGEFLFFSWLVLVASLLSGISRSLVSWSRGLVFLLSPLLEES